MPLDIRQAQRICSTLMKVTIQLAAEDYGCLKKHIPKRGTAYTSVKNAKELIGFKDGPFVRFAIECDEKDAQALLKAAQEHCVQAGPQIEAALQKCNVIAANPAAIVPPATAGPEPVLSRKSAKT